ncbi:hypothetical protein HOLleu_31057 [Holothuria leucospilota]|uniref:Integrase zinc-binding domain-containing protein n=1 Tax=Holothuria leucospilota TaxID=206669 RepID=A0A9Q1BLD4_HOLLE|nr:hypothetical protein HOLleu_31057 [Holothuria leucospilota]
MSETDIKGDVVADEGSQAQVDDQASGTKPIRQRTLTEKGQQYQIEQGEHKFRNLISTWRRRASEIECLLSEQGDISQVKGLRDTAMSVMAEITSVYFKLDQLLLNVGLMGSKYKAYEEVENEHYALMKRVSEFIRELDESKSLKDSRSSKSHLSKSSKSSISIKVDAEIKAASLEAKLKYIEVKAKYKTELERIKFEIAQAKLGAVEKVERQSLTNLGSEVSGECVRFTEDYIRAYRKSSPQISEVGHDHSDNSSVHQTPVPVTSAVPKSDVPVTNIPASKTQVDNSSVHQTPVPVTSAVPKSDVPVTNIPASKTQVDNSSVHQTPVPVTSAVPKSDVPVTNIPASKSQVDNFAKVLAEQITLNRLPVPEPSVFDGDPLKYPGWKCAIDSLLENKGIPQSEKIHYLKRYVAGPPRQAIEGYFLIPSDSTYKEARDLLEKRYGDPLIITDAFRRKLESWPKIQPNDGQALREFADFLGQCEAAMHLVPGGLQSLDNWENRKILCKLPSWLVTRWGRYLENWDKSKGFPPFREFHQFIQKEATIACNPITSLQSLNATKSRDMKGNSKKGTRGVNNFATKATQVSNSVKVNVKCILCQGTHKLDNCHQFISKSLEERKEYAKVNNLCFGCLHVGHRAKFCRNRIKCKICSKNHPTSLHGDVKPQSEKPQVRTSVGIQTSEVHAGLNCMSGAGNISMSSLTLPVYVSHKDSPENEVLVYALLDTQSDTTFVTERTCDLLGVEGTKTALMLSTLSAKNQVVNSSRVEGLVVRGYNTSLGISLPTAFSRCSIPANRAHIPTPEMARQWSHLQGIANELMPLSECEVGLLIGYNCPRALTPRKIIPSVSDGPYAQQTDLGWGIVGITNPEQVRSDHDAIGFSHFVVTAEVPTAVQIGKHCNKIQVCFKSNVREIISPTQVNRLLELEFNERNVGDMSYSQDDKKFLTILKDGICQLKDGHYQLPLPMKVCQTLPNNKSLAVCRLNHLERKLHRNPSFAKDYRIFMQDIIEKGYAERVPNLELQRDSDVNYIPHHGVYHPKKPGKIRVVFDCSAKFKGTSLNDCLLTGPNLTNNLIGVLCRFRQENIAFAGDIESMFYQFRVNPEQRDLLRFLWWDGGDLSSEPREYRMNVHLFGAGSSPGCANFALKQIATDYESEFGSDAAEFVYRNFYVDDGLKSVPTVSQAVDLITRTTNMLKKGGVRLHKFISNSRLVLESIPEQDHAKVMKNLDFRCDTVPLERALGVQWCVESDTFQFQITLKDQPLTRRGILSTISSVYDPFGFVAPVILLGKQILQTLCISQADWDSPVPDDLRCQWEKWRKGLLELQTLKVDRCYKPVNFGTITKLELHHFSDASTSGHGQCSYIRFVNDRNEVHCAFVIGKSRVVPSKPTTVPRLELTAAVLSVKISLLLRKELEYDNVAEYFWTDSQVVLGYIKNDARRFHVYVANRVQQIRDVTDCSQWNFVRSSENPSDHASRGLTVEELCKSNWLSGPDFLWQREFLTINNEINITVYDNDPEVKCASTLSVQRGEFPPIFELERFEGFSSWFKLKRAIALCLQFKERLRSGKLCHSSKNGTSKVSHKIDVKQLSDAELKIIKVVQAHGFGKEFEILKSVEGKQRRFVSKASSLYGLDPFVDENGVIRVGGRLHTSNLEFNLRHPIVIPKKGHVTRLLIRHFHAVVSHQGRGFTVNEIRANGFWIIGCSSLVAKVIRNCVKCRKFRGKFNQQKMSDLPVDRIEPSPPFSYCGVEFSTWLMYFGPGGGKNIYKHFNIVKNGILPLVM